MRGAKLAADEMTETLAAGAAMWVIAAESGGAGGAEGSTRNHEDMYIRMCILGSQNRHLADARG